MVTVDPTQAVRGTRRVNRALDRTASTARRTQSSLRGVFATLGGALILQQSVTTMASFGQAMSTVLAITEATADVFVDLREKAEDLGATTRFTATQAAEGMLFLARAGFDTNQVLATIEGTLQLAQAGALALGRAADIASNILKGFRLEVSQTERVVDVLAKAANSSNTTVEQLGQAMKFVAPIAAGLGVSLETTAAAMGALSDAGLQSTMAGTGLRKVLTRLENPTAVARKIFRALRVDTDDLRISQVGLIAALQRLATAGITTADALEIFGDRGGPAFEVLISSIPGVIELEEKLLKAGGTAKRVATIMDDNLNGSLLRVKSAFESVILSLGRAGGEGGLRGLLDTTTTLLRIMADNADTLAVVLGALATVITVRLVQGAIVLLIGGIKSLGVAMLALSARVIPLLVTAAATSFAALAVVATVNGKTIKETFEEITDSVGDFVGELVEGFQNSVEVVNAFEDRIGSFNREIDDMGGFASLTKDQITGLREGIKSLRDEIKSRLLLQELLAPSSEGVKQLTNQVEILEQALAKLRGLASGTAATPELVMPEPKKRDQLDPEFQRILDQLKREAEGLREVGREREILEGTLEAELSLKRQLTTTEEGLLRTVLEDNLALRDQQEILEDLRAPAEEYGLALAALAKLETAGKVTTEEATRARRLARIEMLETQRSGVAGIERGLLKLQDTAGDFAATTEEALTNAFGAATTAMEDFFMTGELGFEQLVNSIIRDLTRLAIQRAIIAPLAGLFNTTSSGGGAGGTGFLSRLGSFEGVLAGGSLGGLFGFANGGSFTVGGPSGRDRTPVQFMATRGEEVEITPAGGRRSRGVTNIFNVRPQTLDNFNRSLSQLQNQAAAGVTRAGGRA